MNAREFLHQIDDTRIVEAIKAAELRTSGEIRVFVSHRKRKAPVLERAAARFEKLGMSATQNRNAVLLYLAPRDREFAIVGDKGIHEKCGPGFWVSVSQEIQEHFRRGNYTEGLLAAIDRAGDLLAQHFSRKPDDRDELPNDVLRD